MIPFPTKKYTIIYADPPWIYDDTLNHDPAFGGITYNQMEVEDICKLPVNTIAADNSILFMWVTCPLLHRAFEIIRSWGFEYKTVAFVWVKTDSDGQIRTGIGRYTNSNAELCLLAKKGDIDRIRTDIKQICLSPIRGHSQKPLEIYTRIENMYGPQSRIELFARNQRQGWDAWGDQLPQYTQKLLVPEVQNGKDKTELV